MQTIIEVSAHRTGSSALSEMLRKHEQVYGLGEVFHWTQHWEWGEKAAAFFGPGSCNGGQLKPEIATDLGRLKREDPVSFIVKLSEVGTERGYKAIQFKVFPGHLSWEAFDTILRRTQPLCYCLTRRPVDMYISQSKATELGKWGRVDTTTLKPRIEVSDFLTWHAARQKHWQVAMFLAKQHGIAMPCLHYEHLYSKGQDPVETLRAFYKTLGVDLGVRTGASLAQFVQDKAKTPRDKVANWDEFHASLEALGKTALLDSFDMKGAPMRVRLYARARTIFPRIGARIARRSSTQRSA